MTTHAIPLRLINHGAACHSPIAIFRRAAPEAPAIAWHIVDGLAAGASHAFHYDVPAGDPRAPHVAPTIWIGVGSQIAPGQVLSAAPLTGLTELSLVGIAEAEIAMTGGGPGPTSEPFAFGLENIKYPL